MLVPATIIRCNACSNEIRLEGKRTLKEIKEYVELSGWEWHRTIEDTHYCFIHAAVAHMDSTGEVTLSAKGKYRKQKYNKGR